MKIVARWDRDSEQWIDRLKSFVDLLVPGVRGACDRVAAHTVTQARANMPYFEGGLKNDFRVLESKGRTGKGLVLGKFSVGFTNSTVMDAIESLDSNSKPFAVGLGKHHGADAHRVMLYNPRTKGSTPGRAKLIRYLKSVNAEKYGSLPDNADKEDVDKWRRGHGRPWVWVNPRTTSTTFLWDLMADEGDPLLTELVELVWNQMAMVWSR